jgi:hypothetical protein
MNSRNSNINNSDLDGLYSLGSAAANFNPAVMSVANSSISSNGTNAMSFNSIIKDFKKALSERKTPLTLVILNRIMIFILLATIALSSAIFTIDNEMTIEINRDNI